MAKKKKGKSAGKKKSANKTPAVNPKTSEKQPKENSAISQAAMQAKIDSAEAKQKEAEAKLKIEKSKGIPSANKQTGKTEITYTDEQLAERELRRYVKKSGGFRKGLGPKAIERAEHLLELLERKEVVWDETILIKGFTDVLKDL